MRVGIDIGGTSAKIGLVDQDNCLVATTSVETGNEASPEEVIRKIAEKTLELMEQKNIEVEQCVGVGIGVPGTVDRKNGKVIYSNNLKWENVELSKGIETYIPAKVSIANDADCAALGEAVAGAGKGCENLIMVTLGTGVGGGVIIDGKLYEGRMIGGCEIGHMVVVENGKECTCGRKGCLEAYASATALKRDARETFGREITPLELFGMVENDDEKAKKIVADYIGTLGTGIVNLVNIFRPEKVLLGGGISAQGEVLLKPIREKMEKECFGGSYGELPEIAIATLGNAAGMLGAASLML